MGSGLRKWLIEQDEASFSGIVRINCLLSI